jgi:hypothetical protein
MTAIGAAPAPASDPCIRIFDFIACLLLQAGESTACWCGPRIAAHKLRQLTVTGGRADTRNRNAAVAPVTRRRHCGPR